MATTTVGLAEIDLLSVNIRPDIGEERFQEDHFDGKLTVALPYPLLLLAT